MECDRSSLHEVGEQQWAALLFDGQAATALRLLTKVQSTFNLVNEPQALAADHLPATNPTLTRSDH